MKKKTQTPGKLKLYIQIQVTARMAMLTYTEQEQKSTSGSPVDRTKPMHLCCGQVGDAEAGHTLNNYGENLLLINFKPTHIPVFSGSSENRHSLCILSLRPLLTGKHKRVVIICKVWYCGMSGLTHSHPFQLQLVLVLS